MEDTEKEVLKRIRPDGSRENEIRAAISAIGEKIAQAIDEVRSDMGVEYEIGHMLVGSTAKGTYDNDPDIDYFVMFPLDAPETELKEVGLAIGRKVVEDPTEKYAQHPYITGHFMGFEVDIVPAYWIESPEERVTAVDRTPLHTRFVLENLRPELRDHVRLLKRFMKGIGAYGAEASVQGFSGYLVELLVIKYGGFRQVLKASYKWKKGKPILITDTPPEREFDSPLVVIDPTDPARNVASAVSARTLSLFVMAAREYLSAPSMKFFFPNPKECLSASELKGILDTTGSMVIAVSFDAPDIIEDHLHDQCRRTLDAITAQLRHRHFAPLRTGYIAGKAGEKCVLVVEYSFNTPPGAVLRRGPHWSEKRIIDFVHKYMDAPAGFRPFVDEDGGWCVYVPIKDTVREAVEFALKKGRVGKDLKGIFLAGDYALKVKVEDMDDQELKALTETLAWTPPWRR